MIFIMNKIFIYKKKILEMNLIEIDKITIIILKKEILIIKEIMINIIVNKETLIDNMVIIISNSLEMIIIWIEEIIIVVIIYMVKNLKKILKKVEILDLEINMNRINMVIEMINKKEIFIMIK